MREDTLRMYHEGYFEDGMRADTSRMNEGGYFEDV